MTKTEWHRKKAVEAAVAAFRDGAELGFPLADRRDELRRALDDEGYAKALHLLRHEVEKEAGHV